MHEYRLRFAVALGGFLIFMGILMVSISAMVYFKFVDVSSLENEEYRMMSLWILLVVGIFDLLSGIILRRK